MELERGEYYIAGAESGTVDREAGRATVDGLYAAGWMTNETVHQAVVSAGHDARAAVSLIRDDVATRYWPAVADHYVDWVVREGRYAGDARCREVRRAFHETARPHSLADVDDADAESLLETVRSEFTESVAVALAPTTDASSTP